MEEVKNMKSTINQFKVNIEESFKSEMTNNLPWHLTGIKSIKLNSTEDNTLSERGFHVW